MKIDSVSKEMVSLNDQLYDDLFINELEKRLETDPLMGGGVLELFGGGMEAQVACFTCTLCSPICSPIIGE
jgi:hypothetical protein